jgi:hypothetical protein
MPGMRRRALRLTAVLGGLVLWAVALWGSGFLVTHVIAPEDACYQEAVGWFEPTEVTRARVSAWPPLIRCTLVDPRYPTRTTALWHWGDLAVLAAVDVAAVALAVAVVRGWRVARIVPEGRGAEQNNSTAGGS